MSEINCEIARNCEDQDSVRESVTCQEIFDKVFLEADDFLEATVLASIVLPKKPKKQKPKN